jgi:AcrR family transcriptional regulator
VDNALVPPAKKSKEGARRALVEAARRVFLQLGYQGATLDRIAAEAGYTKGAVYWHFKNKEALFLELLADALRRNLDALDGVLRIASGNPRKLERDIAGYIDRQLEGTVPMLALELEIEGRRNPSLAAVFDIIILDHQNAICRVLERYYAIVGREPPIPATELAALFLVLAQGSALQRQTRPERHIDVASAVKILLGMPLHT